MIPIIYRAHAKSQVIKDKITSNRQLLLTTHTWNLTEPYLGTTEPTSLQHTPSFQFSTRLIWKLTNSSNTWSTTHSICTNKQHNIFLTTAIAILTACKQKSTGHMSSVKSITLPCESNFPRWFVDCKIELHWPNFATNPARSNCSGLISLRTQPPIRCEHRLSRERRNNYTQLMPKCKN
jgi:hypothetical protein